MLVCICLWINGSMPASAVEWMGEWVDIHKHACLQGLDSTASLFYNRSLEYEKLTGYLGFPADHSQWVPGLIVFGSLMPFACQGQVELFQACKVLRACRSGSWCQHASVSQRHILNGLIGRSVSSECELWKCQGGLTKLCLSKLSPTWACQTLQEKSFCHGSCGACLTGENKGVPEGGSWAGLVDQSSL